MKFDLLMQNEENNLSSEIVKAFESKPKKAYFFIGNLKDTGFRILEEEIIDTKTKLYFALGIDKKNTTRVMLEDVLRYTNDVYVYSNNNQIEYDSNILIFEYSDNAVFYQISGSMSDAGIKDNISIYSKVVFDLSNDNESKEYKQIIKNIQKSIQTLNFELLTSEKIEELVENKEIFTTRQYVHNVKSIAELLGSKESDKPKVEEKDDDVSASEIEIPKVDLSDLDFDIDIDIPEEEVKVQSKEVEEKVIEKEVIKKDKNIYDDIKVEFEEKELANQEILKDLVHDEYVLDKDNELYDEFMEDMNFDINDTLDINNMLFSKADMKLDFEAIEEVQNEKEEVKEDEILKVKKVNLNAISNYIYELPSRPSKGQEVNSLKIPSYIQNMIPEFFELAEKGKNVKINDADYKVRDVKLEVVDAKNNKKYTDREAKLTLKNGQSYMLINTDTLANIEYDEKDIARIIKLSSDIYHIEIISKDMQEYKIWNKLCNQKFKSADRNYGMM